MIVVVATTIGILSVVLRGGKLGRLAHLELRYLWVIWLTIAVQTAIFELPPTIVSDSLYGWVHIATYVTSFVFLWLNRRIPGATIIAIGAAANFAAIAANDGIMPASASAWRTAGLPTLPESQFENSDVTPQANLAVLGDIFAIPDGWPLANVFSIGDVIIVLGGTWLAHMWCCRPVPGEGSDRADDGGPSLDSAQADQTAAV